LPHWHKKTNRESGWFNLKASAFVGMARFELATSWSQTRRDDRTTLHPEPFGKRVTPSLRGAKIGNRWQNSDENLKNNRSVGNVQEIGITAFIKSA
jgi:hypothetical protein